MNGFIRFDDLPRTHLIAEIGINHNGSVQVVKNLVDFACVSGWDCIKLQKRNPDVCVPAHQKSVMRDTPWGRMSYLDYRKKLEFGRAEYDAIWTYCLGRIDSTASVWDRDSVDFMLALDIPYIKIPSALLTDDELLLYVCGAGAPVLLSTGMSTIEEIDHAVGLLSRHSDNFALLHCNSSYPAKEEELNLRMIPALIERYGCTVGYSGHEFGLATTLAAAALGARIIERHVTLKRTMWGTDQMVSVEPQGMLKLSQQIRALEVALGDGKKRVYPSELPVREKLRPVRERQYA